VLVIRAAQMKALAEVAEKAFVERASDYLRETFPEKCAELGPEAVHRWVRSGLEKARGYGLRLDVEVLRYLNLMYTFGWDFDRLPWAAEILDDTEVSAAGKIEELMEAAFEAEAALAEQTHG